ncbi:LysR family transcriptional regulator [Acidiphilium sp. AL]|uniref:LysR family transcriptional regulator n=1 Tax=Acidiphilium iwatense TaxID=768198 RepID=A0ABS9E0U1_9PROT|nr:MULTISPECIES: LysR family transcriptional regulator [Acidiphilium]MCF3947531.1 LysR family transcriptional regulator [Acidiphilium iwatense]MCU4161161.1 LysR family transcriptional regulator [Acidiphilium sp. AL]
MLNVTIRQLRAFILVSRERSFTRAAARLHVSASALTVSIRDLEAEIGLRLFDRSTRSVEATPQAIAFLPIAERLLDELDRALEDLHSFAERQKGSVTVSAAASFIVFVLAPAIAELAQIYPNITVRVVEDTTEGTTSRVLSGEADFGVTTLWRTADDAFTAIPLLQDRYGILAPLGHPLTRGDGPLDWSALLPYPIVSLGPEAGIRAQLDHHPKLRSLLARPTYEVSNVAALQALVSRSAGISVVPALMARQAGDRAMAFRPLIRPSLQREIFLVRARRRNFAPAAQALVSLMLETLRMFASDEYISPNLAIDRKGRIA